jgi:NhaP-type Na+/H+ or K+/H+ antiporter
MALVGISAILILGIGAQWLAWRMRLPSILLLLLFGFLAGPVSWYATDRWLGRSIYLDPDAIFGDLLLPLVSVSVALILFEGGLSLTLREISNVGRVVRNLVSVGALVTWVIAAAAAHWIVGLDAGLAVLFGAILTVTGPTVIGPLLRHVRPAGRVGPILRWEGIVIDPIGAMFAVLVFEAILLGGFPHATGPVAVAALKTVLIGCAVGAAAAFLLVFVLRRFWVPDHLQSPVTMMFVVAAFQGSNLLQHESGLFTVVVMGIVLANQTRVSIRHIMEFKEALSVLLISALFIVLAARVELWFFRFLSGKTALFLLVLIFVARPLSVAVSTIGSGLNWRERLFLCWMAPRGIVAAAVASVFALRLHEAGLPEAELLVPLMFTVIAATVVLYATTSAWVARRLGLALPAAQGFLFVGAHEGARRIAEALHREGCPVLLADTNRQNVAAARLAGLPAVAANVLSPTVAERQELTGIGRLLAMTPSGEVNALAALHFAKVFGRSAVFQLDPGDEDQAPQKRGGIDRELCGRVLFADGLSFRRLAERVEQGAAVKTTRLTEEFDFRKFSARYGARALPLFVMDASGGVTVFAGDAAPVPRPGQTLVSLVDRAPEETPRQAQPEVEAAAL